MSVEPIGTPTPEEDADAEVARVWIIVGADGHFHGGIYTEDERPKWIKYEIEVQDRECDVDGKQEHRVVEFVPAIRLSALAAEVTALKAQLPSGMEHCTIVFKECAKGHGRLTATNWVDHGCPTCERDALKEKLADAEKQNELLEDDIVMLMEKIKKARECANFLRDGRPQSDCERALYSGYVAEMAKTILFDLSFPAPAGEGTRKEAPDA